MYNVTVPKLNRVPKLHLFNKNSSENLKSFLIEKNNLYIMHVFQIAKRSQYISTDEEFPGKSKIYENVAMRRS